MQTSFPFFKKQTRLNGFNQGTTLRMANVISQSGIVLSTQVTSTPGSFVITQALIITNNHWESETTQRSYNKLKKIDNGMHTLGFE